MCELQVHVLLAGTRTVYRTSHDDIVHNIHLFNISIFTHKSTLVNQHVVVDIHSNVDSDIVIVVFMTSVFDTVTSWTRVQA